MTVAVSGSVGSVGDVGSMGSMSSTGSIIDWLAISNDGICEP